MQQNSTFGSKNIDQLQVNFPTFSMIPSELSREFSSSEAPVVPYVVPQVRRHAAPGALPPQPGGGAGGFDAAATPAAPPGRPGHAAGALRAGRGRHDGLLRGEHGERTARQKCQKHGIHGKGWEELLSEFQRLELGKFG